MGSTWFQPAANFLRILVATCLIHHSTTKAPFPSFSCQVVDTFCKRRKPSLYLYLSTLVARLAEWHLLISIRIFNLVFTLITCMILIASLTYVAVLQSLRAKQLIRRETDEPLNKGKMINCWQQDFDKDYSSGYPALNGPPAAGGQSVDSTNMASFQKNINRAFIQSAVAQNIQIQQQLMAQNQALQHLLHQSVTKLILVELVLKARFLILCLEFSMCYCCFLFPLLYLKVGRINAFHSWSIHPSLASLYGKIFIACYIAVRYSVNTIWRKAYGIHMYAIGNSCWFESF